MINLQFKIHLQHFKNGSIMSFNSTKAELSHNNHQKLVNTAEDGVYTGKEAYQQRPDQASDVTGHAGSLGVT